MNIHSPCVNCFINSLSICDVICKISTDTFAGGSICSSYNNFTHCITLHFLKIIKMPIAPVKAPVEPPNNADFLYFQHQISTLRCISQVLRRASHGDVSSLGANSAPSFILSLSFFATTVLQAAPSSVILCRSNRC